MTCRGEATLAGPARSRQPWPPSASRPWLWVRCVPTDGRLACIRIACDWPKPLCMVHPLLSHVSSRLGWIPSEGDNHVEGWGDGWVWLGQGYRRTSLYNSMEPVQMDSMTRELLRDCACVQALMHGISSNRWCVCAGPGSPQRPGIQSPAHRPQHSAPGFIPPQPAGPRRPGLYAPAHGAQQHSAPALHVRPPQHAPSVVLRTVGHPPLPQGREPPGGAAQSSPTQHLRCGPAGSTAVW